MQIIKRLFFFSTIALFFSCRLFRPTAYFFISNGSKDKSSVDIQIKIGGQTVFNDSIHYTDVRPDLQYTPSATLTKGKYTIFITVDGGKISLTQPIMLDSDRWIFISYSYTAPVDSIQRENLIKYFGYDTSYLNTKLRRIPYKVGIYIMDKEPVHM